MLNWNSHHGDSLSLTVEGYQFPEALDGHDANWLTLAISAKNRLGAWTARAACVLAWDLPSLAFWLADIETDEAESWSGLETDLVLTNLGWFRGQAVIAVALSCGLKNAVADGSGRGEKDLLIVELAEADLAVSIASVAATADRLPPRGTQGEKSAATMRALREERLRNRGEEH